MIANNLLIWSLQIGALVIVAAITQVLLRLRFSRVRLWYWQLTLLACLALPVVRPWRHEVIMGEVSISMAVVRPVASPGHRTIPLQEAPLWLLAMGIVARAGWLTVGLWQLRRYRRRSRPFAVRDGAQLLLSDSVASPVTFGARQPVVLLPAQFPDLDPCVQEAILCHELLHVRRRDWLFTVAEEVVRTLLWFHPAIWWVLGEIGLAREQEVDRLVVERTRSREEYVDALLAIAGARPRLDLAPAPLFLRKRHLKQRLVSILKEVQMSKTRLVSSMATAVAILAAVGWLVTAAFPLAAEVADSQGVSVDLGGATLLHRPPVLYPGAARKKGIQGTVMVQAKLDDSGAVSDAQVLSGPDELRKEALQSVLNWHFSAEYAGSIRVITIAFQTDTTQAAPPPPAPQQMQRVQVGGNVQSAKLILQSRPNYPPLAKQARIQGVVKLHAFIAKDGTVEDLNVISGHPLLVPSAIEAVRQWVYAATYLNGNPVEVETEIDVNYTLAQ